MIHYTRGLIRSGLIASSYCSTLVSTNIIDDKDACRVHSRVDIHGFA